MYPVVFVQSAFEPTACGLYDRMLTPGVRGRPARAGPPWLWVSVIYMADVASQDRGGPGQAGVGRALYVGRHHTIIYSYYYCTCHFSHYWLAPLAQPWHRSTVGSFHKVAHTLMRLHFALGSASSYLPSHFKYYWLGPRCGRNSHSLR